MPELHIVGAGGHAKVVVALAEAAGYQIARIYDDASGPLASVLGHRVDGTVAELPDTSEVLAVIAIGSNTVRRKIAARFTHIHWAALIHPTAWVSPGVSVGAGSIIMAGSVIQPGTEIGRHVIVNTSASVDHDCRLHDYAHVAPGCRLAGNVHFGEGVFAGLGSGFTPGSTVGAWTVIGAGALVNSPIPANVTAVGLPARVVKHRSPNWHLNGAG